MCVPHQPYTLTRSLRSCTTRPMRLQPPSRPTGTACQEVRGRSSAPLTAHRPGSLCVLSYPIHAHHTRLLYTLVCLPPTLTPNPYQVPCPAWRSRPGLLALGLVPEFGKGARENPQSQNSRPILQPLVTTGTDMRLLVVFAEPLIRGALPLLR